MKKIFTTREILCNLLECDMNDLEHNMSENQVKIINLIDDLLRKDTFENLAENGMQYLKKNHHPHTCIIINHDGAELFEGIKGIYSKNI